MMQRQKQRSSGDVTDWFQRNAESSLQDLVAALKENPGALESQGWDGDHGKIRRVFTHEELLDPNCSIYVNESEIPDKSSMANSGEPRTDHAELKSEHTEKQRPKINISGEFHDVVSQAIFALSTNVVFQQGGYLVRVLNIDEDDQKNTPGDVVIRQYTPVSMRDYLSSVAKWVKPTKDGGYAECDGPRDQIARGVLERGEYSGIPVIRGIVESPFLRKDGSICFEHGFDHQSGFYLNLSVDVEPPPEKPIPFDAAQAYLTLREPFEEFPFIDEGSRAVPIALVLTALARPMFENVPAFIFDASTRGSGKTLIIDVVSLILTGKTSPKYTWPTGRDCNTELEKIMNSAALQGSPIMCFDNIPGTVNFGGSVLEKFITCNGRINFRLLGTNTNRETFFNSIIVANGNNLLDGIQDETRRRVMPSRMVPKCEKPEEQTGFKHSPLQKYVLDNRPKLLQAALTLLIFSLQNPTDTVPWGSFESWTETIPPAIKKAANLDIMKNKELVPVSGGDENEAWGNLLEILSELFITGFTARKVIDKAASVPRLKEALESVFYGQLPDTVKLGRRLKSRKDRIQNGLCVLEMGSISGTKLWNVKKITD